MGMPTLRIAVTAAVFATGCVLGQDDAPQGPGSPSEIYQAAEQDPECDLDACGNGNSPVMDGVWFWKLHTNGLPSSTDSTRAVSITDVVSAGDVHMRLVAEGDRLVGYDQALFDAGMRRYVTDGKGLNNTKIYVLRGGEPYVIRIEVPVTGTAQEQSKVAFWVPNPASNQTVPLYRFHYQRLQDEQACDPRTACRWRPLCKRPPGEPPDPDDQWLNAIVFRGDVYDPKTKDIAIDAARTDGWMNIACYMGAPYKMHMMGRTTVANTRLGIATSLDERKALLNAWTMNACGTGKAFTVQGTEISLRDRWPTDTLDGADYLPEATWHEAVWGPTGALCLNYHRRATSWKDNEARLTAIAAECSPRGVVLDSCSALWDSMGTAINRGYFRTGARAYPGPVIAPP
jgi:hypothetical protein